MKDKGEADVIIGIRIKRENNGLTITQSHYIGKKIKKFNYEGCGPVSTPMEAGAISWASKKKTCITNSTMESEFVALAAAGKGAEWLRNLISEIPLWPKPISLIYMHYDSAATLAKAYTEFTMESLDT
ncbi:hypothetical protein Tco_1555758 [Tanacetum coccineum]